ncbi:MAG TPA: hypothetical protein VNX02_05550 [Steroidobacteraceae bacterium]|nr:hypothetical protein [Steroidobacteraceae bacterium]
MPHYLRDTLELSKYVNLLRLLPTLWVMALHPRHFFKSVPAILKDHKQYYISPLHFVTNVTLVQAAAVKLFYAGEPIEWRLIVLNLFLAMALPIFATTVCAVVISLHKAVTVVGPLMARSVSLDGLFDDDDGDTAVKDQLKQVNLKTPFNLDWPRFFWSMLYFYLYCYLILGVLVAITLFANATVVPVVEDIFDYLVRYNIFVLDKLFVVLMLVIAWYILRILLRTLVYPCLVVVASCDRRLQASGVSAGA